MVLSLKKLANPMSISFGVSKKCILTLKHAITFSYEQII